MIKHNGHDLSVHFELIDRYERKKIDSFSSLSLSGNILSSFTSLLIQSMSSTNNPSSSSSSSTSNIDPAYESSLDKLRSLLPNSDAKGMSDYDVVRSATDYIETLIKDTGTSTT